MADDLLVLITKPPYGLEDAFAGMRLALGGLVSGLVPSTSTLLMGDGTLNAIADQRPEALGMPSNVEAIQDLLDLDSPVYCVEEDLRERAGPVKVMDGVKLISWAEARKVLQEHHLVTTF